MEQEQETRISQRRTVPQRRLQPPAPPHSAPQPTPPPRPRPDAWQPATSRLQPEQGQAQPWWQGAVPGSPAGAPDAPAPVPNWTPPTGAPAPMGYTDADVNRWGLHLLMAVVGFVLLAALAWGIHVRFERTFLLLPLVGVAWVVQATTMYLRARAHRLPPRPHP